MGSFSLAEPSESGAPDICLVREGALGSHETHLRFLVERARGCSAQFELAGQRATVTMSTFEGTVTRAEGGLLQLLDHGFPVSIRMRVPHVVDLTPLAGERVRVSLSLCLPAAGPSTVDFRVARAYGGEQDAPPLLWARDGDVPSPAEIPWRMLRIAPDPAGRSRMTFASPRETAAVPAGALDELWIGGRRYRAGVLRIRRRRAAFFLAVGS